MEEKIYFFLSLCLKREREVLGRKRFKGESPLHFLFVIYVRNFVLFCYCVYRVTICHIDVVLLLLVVKWGLFDVEFCMETFIVCRWLC